MGHDVLDEVATWHINPFDSGKGLLFLFYAVIGMVARGDLGENYQMLIIQDSPQNTAQCMAKLKVILKEVQNERNLMSGRILKKGG